MERRSFLGAILALGAAPAIVRASSLMPMRSIQIATLDDTLAFSGPLYSKIVREALNILDDDWPSVQQMADRLTFSAPAGCRRLVGTSSWQ